MKIELTDEQLDDLIRLMETSYETSCPSEIAGLRDTLCVDGHCIVPCCERCWENALKSLEIKEGVK